MSSCDSVTVLYPPGVSSEFKCAEKSRTICRKINVVGNVTCVHRERRVDTIRCPNELLGSYWDPVMRRCVSCPFRSGRFLAKRSQFVLPDWKPDPPWRDAHHQTDTPVPFTFGPGPESPLACMRYSAGHTVMSPRFISSL